LPNGIPEPLKREEQSSIRKTPCFGSLFVSQGRMTGADGRVLSLTLTGKGLYAAPPWSYVDGNTYIQSPRVDHVFATWSTHCPTAWRFLLAPRSKLPLQYIETCVFQNTLQKAIIDGDTVLLLIREDLWRILEVPGFI
jgi:hypothetical protein